MDRRYIVADVFTDQAFGGNPLAVLLDGQGLDTRQMQAIAREFNLSETVFVFPPETPDQTRRIRIFTPTDEMPFAGHPTIGTALILAKLGAFDLSSSTVNIVLGENAGPVPVALKVEGGEAVSAILTAPGYPEIHEAPHREEVPAHIAMAALLSLQPEDVVQAVTASCGVPFILVELRNRQALEAARFDHAVAAIHLDKARSRSCFMFTSGGCDQGYDIHARMFAPLSGILEDPATGSAAAAYGGWLGLNEPLQDGVIRRVIAQGIEMGRPSRLEVEIEKRGGEVKAVRVGGQAVLISDGRIRIPGSRP